MVFIEIPWLPPADLSDRAVYLSLEKAFGKNGMRSVDRPHQVRLNTDYEEQRIERCVALMNGEGLKFIGVHREVSVRFGGASDLIFFGLRGKWGNELKSFMICLDSGGSGYRWKSEDGEVFIPLDALLRKVFGFNRD